MKIVVSMVPLISDSLVSELRAKGFSDVEQVWDVSKKELHQRIQGAVVLVSQRVNADVIAAAAPTLRLIHTFSIGVNNVDTLAALKANVEVAHTHAPVTSAAEHTFALILAAAKQVVPSDRYLRKGHWRYRIGGGHPSKILSGSTLGVIGLGRIGQRIAQYANAFEMNVIGIRRSGKPVKGCQVYPPNKLQYVLSLSDIVVVALPLTNETKNMIGEEDLMAMKSTSIIINIGRGAVIQEKALYQALKKGIIAGAALDVWWLYPRRSKKGNSKRTKQYPSKFPYHQLENITMTPHRGGFTSESKRIGINQIVENIVRLRDGKPLKNLVNRELGY